MTTTDCLTNIVAGAADPNVPTFTIGKMAHDGEYAGVSKDHIRETSRWKTLLVVLINEEERCRLIRVEVRLVDETAH